MYTVTSSRPPFLARHPNPQVCSIALRFIHVHRHSKCWAPCPDTRSLLPRHPSSSIFRPLIPQVIYVHLHCTALKQVPLTRTFESASSMSASQNETPAQRAIKTRHQAVMGHRRNQLATQTVSTLSNFVVTLRTYQALLASIPMRTPHNPTMTVPRRKVIATMTPQLLRHANRSERERLLLLLLYYHAERRRRERRRQPR